MTDIEQLQHMIDDLRRLRNSCEPKTNQNPRYLRYSNAVSNLLWIVSHLQSEETHDRCALCPRQIRTFAPCAAVYKHAVRLTSIGL